MWFPCELTMGGGWLMKNSLLVKFGHELINWILGLNINLCIVWHQNLISYRNSHQSFSWIWIQFWTIIIGALKLAPIFNFLSWKRNVKLVICIHFYIWIVWRLDGIVQFDIISHWRVTKRTTFNLESQLDQL